MSPVKVKNTLAGFTTVLCAAGALLKEDWDAALVEAHDPEQVYPFAKGIDEHTPISFQRNDADLPHRAYRMLAKIYQSLTDP